MASIATKLEYECGALVYNTNHGPLRLQPLPWNICSVAVISFQGATTVSTSTNFVNEPGALVRERCVPMADAVMDGISGARMTIPELLRRHNVLGSVNP